MLLKFVTIALAAGALALLGSSLVVAEPAIKVITLPQPGTGKRPLATVGVDALNAMSMHVMKHWKPPADVTNPEELIVVRVRLSLKPDRTLADGPRVMTVGATERHIKAREAAVRAIYRAQPFTMLPPRAYDAWKEIEVTFDPRSASGR